MRKSDFVVRCGGEEFIVLLIDSDINQAQVIAEQLRSKVANSSDLSSFNQKQITISLEVTDKDTIDTVLKRADDALYKAKSKSKGKNCIVSE